MNTFFQLLEYGVYTASVRTSIGHYCTTVATTETRSLTGISELPRADHYNFADDRAQ